MWLFYHPLPLPKNMGQCSQMFPTPSKVCKLEGSASVLSDEEGGYPLLWGQGTQVFPSEEGSGNGREWTVLGLLPPVSFSVYGEERPHLAACVWG